MEESANQTPEMFVTIVELAERETAGVRKRIDDELAKIPEIDLLFKQLGSYVFNTAQRLIDLKSKTGIERRRDEAIIRSAPRIFNECYAAYDVARSGLALQATVLLRSAFEVATQTVLFTQDESEAEEWLNGKRIDMRDVRAKLHVPPEMAATYTRLTRLSHPNLQALRFYSIPVPARGGYANFYGGFYAPKAAALVAVDVLGILMFYLDGFYEVYEKELWAHGLTSTSPTLTWSQLLGVWKYVLADVSAAAEALPDDAMGFSEGVAITRNGD